MFEYLREDIKRYFREGNGRFDKIKVVLFTQGVWATVIYRAGSYCVSRKKSCAVFKIVLPFLSIAEKLVEITTGIVLPFTAKIGKGLYIGHFGTIIVSYKAVIGEYCNISQENTIGQSGRRGQQNAPVIGDRVYLGPGAKIFGKIRIGNDVAIGANAVVSKDIPDNAVVVGNPAKIISYEGSRDFIVIQENGEADLSEERESKKLR